jgi:hypothetical protein
MNMESVRSELRSLRDQELKIPFGRERDVRALQKRGETLITSAGLWGTAPDLYARWLDGDIDLAPLKPAESNQASRPAAYAIAASGAASSAPPPARSSTMTPSPPPRAPMPLEAGAAYVASVRGAQTTAGAQASAQGGGGSRAAQVAEIHLAGINMSRKRCGLAPLTAAELAPEFADLDRQPANPKVNRRDAGNAIAARQGAPSTQSSIDEMWAGIAAKRNSTLPGRDLKTGNGLLPFHSSSPPTTRSGSGPPQNQAEIDVMHAGIVARLNATLPERWRPEAGRAG